MSNALIEMMQKKKAQMSAGRDDFRPFKPGMGQTIVRIMPPWRKAPAEGHDKLFFHDFAQHWIKALDGGKEKIQAVYTCPEKTFGTQCEICATVLAAKQHAKDIGDDELAALVDEAYASQQYLLNVLVLNHPDTAQRTVPTTMQVGKSIFEMITEILLTYIEEGVVIFDLQTGVDLVITREGSGRENTKYRVVASPKGSRPVGKMTGEIPDLDAIIAAQMMRNNEQKALNGVAKAVGLPAPAAGTPAARHAAPGLAAPTAAAVAYEEAEDATYVEVAPAAAPVAAVAAPVAAAATDVDELEALLADFDL